MISNERVMELLKIMQSDLQRMQEEISEKNYSEAIEALGVAWTAMEDYSFRHSIHLSDWLDPDAPSDNAMEIADGFTRGQIGTITALYRAGWRNVKELAAEVGRPEAAVQKLIYVLKWEKTI